MRNEGPKFLIIVCLILSGMGFLAAEFPIAGCIVFVLGVIGVIGYGIWIEYKRLTFPVPFIEPNEKQKALISYYFEQVEESGHKVKTKPLGLILLFIFTFLSLIVLNIGEKKEYFWFSLISVCVILGIFIAIRYILAHRDTSRFEGYKIAKVEFYDSSYSSSYSTNTFLFNAVYGKDYVTEHMVTYYVFIRSYDGETMKLRVPFHVHNYLAAQSGGMGYLIKYRKKRGMFDLYDFVPEYNDGRFINRK